MRVECEHCRALVEPAWSITGAGTGTGTGAELRARCPACGKDSTAPVAPGAPVAAAARRADPGPVCPKCGLPPVTGDACARCGLAADRMASWADDQTPAPALAAAWDACLAAWDDREVHDRAASVALTVGEQPWLARRYRAVLRDRPDDAMASAGLARVGRIAQAAVLATASTTPVSRFRRGSSYAVLVGLAVLIVGGLLMTRYLLNRSDDEPDQPTRTRATPVAPKVAPWQRPELSKPARVESSPPRQ